MIKREKYEQQSLSMRVINVHGYKHVIIPMDRPEYPINGVKLPDPNYLGTGCALAGVLNKLTNQTLSEFKEIWINNKLILDKISESHKLGKIKK